jgi:hypothetical protein
MWIRIREAQKHVDPDPDPEHCFLDKLKEIWTEKVKVASCGY